MKRGRADGGVSKEQYEAELAADVGGGAAASATALGGFPRAPEKVLQARKIVSASGASSTRAQEATRQLAALNRALVANLKTQWEHNATGSWVENMREYVAYARDIDAKFGGHEGKLLTFGSGDCGQLGHGVEEDEDLMVKFPRVVRPLAKKGIVRVACGGLHSAAITASGEVYTWGCNDDGALGHAGDENIPAKVAGFGPQEATAVQVVGGDCHTAVVTLAGQVYTWGCYRDKEGKQWCDAATAKAAFKQKQTQPFLLKALSNVADIKCGSSFNLARTNDGRVYSWGLGEMGQLGRKVQAEMKDAEGEYKVSMVFADHLAPKLVTLGSDELPAVKSIGCGSYHSLFALSANGYLYTCGLNNYGQLGVGSTDNCSEPQLVEDLSTKNVAYVDAGTHHSVVLTNDGDVYTFGRADSGQLGTLETCKTGEFKDRPQKVVFPRPKAGGSTAIRMVATGSNHALALSESDAIFSWGYGDMLALGNGLDQDENKPCELDWAKAKFGKAEILQIEAGGQHSAVLAHAVDK